MKTKIRKTKKVLSYIIVFAMVLATISPLYLEKVAAATNLTITDSAGWLESAYAEWTPVSGVKGYTAYVKKSSEPDSAFVQLDSELIRQYSGYWRVDAVGLAAGNYVLKIAAVKSDGSSVSAKTGTLTVEANDRSGFAFSDKSTFKTGSGAYNDNGTLKSDAQVIYVTPDTAKTCTAVVNGKTVTGFQSILDVKQSAGTKDTSPLDFRIIGCITADDVDHFSSSSEGIQLKGKSAYTEMNITIEGIGEDAAVHGFGFLVRNCGNVEFRNFAVMSFMDDGISIDSNNCNIWVHNMDLFYGSTGGDSDQAKGDGSVDIKGASTNVTVSYVHFWDSGKCSLCGMSDSAEFLVTYHHNWFDHSDSRHPRIRVASVHIYNNYFDGNAKYGVGTTKGSSAFVEANYFNSCKNPMMSSLQGTDSLGDGTFSGENGGMIKAYNNVVVGASSLIYANSSEGTTSANSSSFDAYLASSRSEAVPSSYKTVAGKTVYNNFDTSSSYDIGVNASDLDAPQDVPAVVTKYAGRMNGGDFKWTFDDSDITDYGVDTQLKSAIANYKSSILAIGGYEGTIDPDQEEETPTEAPTEAPTDETTTKESPTEETTKETSSAVESKTVEHNFSTDGKTSSFLNITGNLSTSKGSVTYNGLTLKTCLKMESSTKVTFNADSKATLTLVFNSSNSSDVKVDGTTYELNNGILELELAKGSHSITKAGSANLFYVALGSGEEGETEAPTEKPTEAVTEAPTEATTEAPTEAPTEKPTEEVVTTKTNVHNFSTDGKTDSFFVITGNLSTSKGKVTYDGLTLDTCLKMESSTNVKFTTSSESKLVLVFNSANSANVKVDGTKYDLTSGILELDIKSGTHTITKADSANLFYMAVSSKGSVEVPTEAETEVPTETETEKPTEEATQSNDNLYVSPSGSSKASGTQKDPMDLLTAINSVQSGKTIYMQSGTYSVYEMYGAPIVIDAANSGKDGAYKTITSIDGGEVILDFSGMAEASSNRGIVLDGSFWHFYDIDICNAGDNGMLLSGDNNVIELCKFYENHDTGLQLSRYDTNANTIDLWPSNNLILNCTAYNNKDEATTENADGFAAKLTCGEGNVFDGCIAYCNSDDGWDLYAKPATGSIGVVTIRNCVAFGNGKLTDGTGSANGDMNGFKLGGSNQACPTPHIVENCVAFNNGATGFTDNGNGGAVTMKNCTAVNNGVFDSNKANFMCYRTSKDAEYTNLISYMDNNSAATDQFLGKINNSLYHYKSGGYYWVNNWTCTDGAKTKYSGSEGKDYTISAADFVNASIPGYNSSNGSYSADYHSVFRNSNGTVNLNGLFEITSSSSLYSAGNNGSYVGAAIK